MRKDKNIALIGTIVFHVLILILFLVIGINRIIPQEEMGVEVVFGDVQQAAGEAQFTEELAVNSQPQETFTPPPAAKPQVQEEVITQDSEESIAIQEKKKKADEQKKIEEEKRKKAEAEERRRKEAEEKRIAEEKRKADAINKRLSGAFANAGSAGQGTAESGTGIQGSPDGNSKTGEYTGVGGKGTWKLDGRRMIGSLPRPDDKSNDEGTIVVKITVDPSGKVTQAVIDAANSRGSVATKQSIREKAIKAALQARFDDIDSKTPQFGTITYIYKTY